MQGSSCKHTCKHACILKNNRENIHYGSVYTNTLIKLRQFFFFCKAYIFSKEKEMCNIKFCTI